MRFLRKALVIFALICVPLSGVLLAEETANATEQCAAQWPERWSIERFRREFCGNDCWEPFNRTMFAIFDIGMEYVVDPFCYLYSSIVPKPLIKGIDNFGENLEFPRRCLSNLLMGEYRASWDATRRFVINSTLGIGGLFDPADDWFYIFDSESTLSDTFAAWGIPAGPPLALPFLPRASLRGHVGYVADYALDGKTWFDFLVPSGIFLGWSWCITPNKAPVWRGAWESIFEQDYDHYTTYMSLASGLTDFNLHQYAWNYYESQYDRAYCRQQAKAFPEGSVARAEKEALAETCFCDVRPPEHAEATRPKGLKGVWRTIPGYRPRAPALDSLRALAFAPLDDDDFWWERRSIFNRDFSKSIEARHIQIATNLPDAVYSYIAAPEESVSGVDHTRFLIVVPGIGAGRTTAPAVALAQVANRAGYAVVIVDSIFHAQSVCSVNEGVLPGYITRDIVRFAAYLKRILDDLAQDKGLDTSDVAVAGWSFGGLTAIHLARLAEENRLPFAVRRFVSLNPPASMDHALEPFAAVEAESACWSKEYAREIFTKTAASLYGWAALDHPHYDPGCPPVDAIGDPWSYAPNLTEDQAKFLMAISMSSIFPDLIAQRHRFKPFADIKAPLTWASRREFYREIGAVSMREYITCYVPQCYPGVAPDEMIATASIRNLAATLKNCAALRVIHTRNDPLLTDEDRAFYDDALRKRITWFNEGGHCGLFYTTPFQDEFLLRLRD